MTKQNIMNKFFVSITDLLIFIILTTSLSSCNDSKAVEKKELLEKTGQVFSQDSFVKWVDLGMVEWAELFIKAGADTNWKDENGESLLSKVCSSGRPQMAKLLIDNGARVNAKDKAGLAPLHWAPFNLLSCIELSELLVGSGADVNIKAKTGLTPLHAAAFNGNLKLVQFLIKNGADTKAVDQKEGTPLDVASRKGHQEIVDFLAAHGGNPAATPKE